MGDMTSHGGSIVLGFPTVLIGGTPASRVTDMHVCPMVTGIVPHVGGPIVLGSFTVLIGNMPAARMGDMAICVGPPDSIVLGCFTVLIGDAGSGSGSGGGAPGMGAGSGATASAAVAIADANTAMTQLDQLLEEVAETDSVEWTHEIRSEILSNVSQAVTAARAEQAHEKESSTKEGYWIEFQFKDAAGLPVGGMEYRFTDPASNESEGLLIGSGSLRRDNLEAAGQGEVVLMSVSQAKWSKEKAKVGDTVKLSAKAEGFEPGTDGVFMVYLRDVKGAHKMVDMILAKTQGDKLEAEWTFAYPEESEEIPDEAIKQYASPEYYFEAIVSRSKARSGYLVFDDVVEITLKDHEGNPIGNEDYILTFSNGIVRKGKVDANGYKKEENVPPAYWKVSFPNMKGAFKNIS